MTEKELLGLKEDIDEAKTELNKLEGRKEGLMQQLLDDWECKTIEQAKKKLISMKSDLEQLDKKIKDGIEELEEKYEFE